MVSTLLPMTVFCGAPPDNTLERVAGRVAQMALTMLKTGLRPSDRLRVSNSNW